MFLILDDSQLRSFFPNVWAVPHGERFSFYDKLLPALEAAEQWLSDNVVSVELLREAAGSKEVADGGLSSKIYDVCRQLVVCIAMYNMAPRLDLKLDANGFATVGTNDLVPISSQRMARLMNSLAANADRCIDALLRALHALPGWLDSECGLFYAGSLFQNLDIVSQVPVRDVQAEKETDVTSPTPRFDRYIALRRRAIEVEQEIADNYISVELLDGLRRRLAVRKLYAEDSRVLVTVQESVLMRLAGSCFSDRRLRRLVDFIRDNPERFPEWETSEAAELFLDHGFKNKKDAPGYFF